MSKLIVATRDGTEHEVEGKVGFSVMEIIHDAGFDEMLALCGGCCLCSTCHVHVDSAFADKVPAMSGDEDELLNTCDYRDERSRLSCQIDFNEGLDGLKVTIGKEND